MSTYEFMANLSAIDWKVNAWPVGRSHAVRSMPAPQAGHPWQA